jgi:ABC-type Fe3+ transport system substrate-binding protein
MRRMACFLAMALVGFLLACGGGAAVGGGAPAGTSAAPPSASSAGASSGNANSAPGQPARAIVEAAAKEDPAFELYMSTNFDKDKLAELESAFNRAHGLQVTLRHTPSGSMTRDAARVITEISAGQAPTWDLMILTDAHYATLFTSDALEKTDWASLGIKNAQSVTYDSTALHFASSFIAPAYNPNLVRAEEAPKDWADLLDAKWRGRMGVSTATHHLGRLAQLWGDERTTRFVEGLAAQQPMLGRTTELFTRLTLGEMAIYATSTDTNWNEAKQAGAPFAFVETVKPVVVSNYSVGVLKGGRRPHTTRLLAAFMTTPEAQTIWEASQGQSSMYVEGSPAWRYAQGKEILPLEARFAAEQLDDLSQKYGRILGYR